jgi:RNase adaptor protein for sRNA GlmZ degradation
MTTQQEILDMTSIEADFALVRRYHDTRMESPFQLQAEEALDRIEAHLNDLQRQRAMFDILRFQLESQRDQMADQLNNEKKHIQELEESHAAMGLIISFFKKYSDQSFFKKYSDQSFFKKSNFPP